MSPFKVRKKARRALVGTSILLGAVLTWSVAGSLPVGGGVIGNFEVDGNMVVDNLAPGSIDWAVAPGVMVSVDDTLDSGFTQGSSEESPGAWVCGKGGANPPKTNLTRTYFNSRVVNSDVFLDLAWVRQTVQGDGSMHVNFELNQLPQTDPELNGNNTDPCPAERVADDVLISYDFGGGANDLPDIRAFTWVPGLNPGVGTWSENLDFNGDHVKAAVNTAATITDVLAEPNEELAPRRFGEATINLSAVVAERSDPCTTFASFNSRSRSSGQSINSALQDRMPTVPISVNTCGAVTIVKETVPADATPFDFTATGLIDGDAFTLDNDATSQIPDQMTFQVAAGDAVTVTEEEASDHVLSAIVCVGTDDAVVDLAIRTVTITEVQLGDDITCTFTNTRRTGDLIITKVVVGGTGTFNFDVDCDDDAFDGQVTITGNDSETITGIPTGVTCTVTEETHPDFDTESNPADGTVTIDDETGATVTFTNTRKDVYGQDPVDPGYGDDDPYGQDPDGDPYGQDPYGDDPGKSGDDGPFKNDPDPTSGTDPGIEVAGETLNQNPGSGVAVEPVQVVDPAVSPAQTASPDTDVEPAGAELPRTGASQVAKQLLLAAWLIVAGLAAMAAGRRRGRPVLNG